MFCSQCGKKLKDTMLFCPNCGAAIEIPDDDEAEITVQAEKMEDAAHAAMNVLSEPEEKVEEPEEEIISFDEMEDVSILRDRERVPEMPPIRREIRNNDEIPDSIFEESDDEEESVQASEEIDLEDGEEEFVPLNVEEPDEAEMKWEKFEPKVERRPPEINNRDEDAVRLDGHAPALKRNAPQRPASQQGKPRKKSAQPQQPRAARTYVPAKNMDPDDLFMDGKDPYDAYDEFDDEEMDYADIPDDDFVYEDDEETSFLLRHIRGIMGLSLTALLAIVCLIYVFSSTGQEALAKMNLAWKPEVYSKIAYDYYQSGLYDMSGSFYEKALARDVENYNYAISAASAYIYGENTDKAASMLKKSISLDPSRVEPYIYLMNLYPDPASRPWDVSQLLQQGYGRTGDDRLKSAAQ